MSDTTPDYGEPWACIAREQEIGDTGDFDAIYEIYTRNNEMRVAQVWNPEDENTQAFDRIVQCVNACQGMADPAKEIAEMREALKEASDALKDFRSFYIEMTKLPPCAANAAIAKIQTILKP